MRHIKAIAKLQFSYYEATRSFTTPPGWDASPSQDTQHKVTRSISIQYNSLFIHVTLRSLQKLVKTCMRITTPPPPGWDASPSQDTQYKVTRSITTPPWMRCYSITGYPAWSNCEHYYSPPGWDASPSQDTQHKQLWALLLPPGWDASPSQDTQHN